MSTELIDLCGRTETLAIGSALHCVRRLSAADRKARLGMIKKALAKGAPVNGVEPGGSKRTALHFAAITDRSEVIELLVAKGAKLGPRDELDDTPLKFALENGNTDAAVALFRAGADYREEDDYGSTPISTLGTFGTGAMVRALLDAGLQLDGDEQMELACTAAQFDKVDILELLNKSGVDLTKANADGVKPIDLAKKYKAKKSVAFLKRLTPKATKRETSAPTLESISVDQVVPIPRGVLAATRFKDVLPDYGAEYLSVFLQRRLNKGPQSATQLVDATYPGSPGHAFGLLELLRKHFGTGAPARSLAPGKLKGTQLFLGDVRVKGDLTLGATRLFVAGSLTVDGVITDCGPDSLLVVGGGLTCTGLNTDGDIVVGGDLKASELIFGYYNDNGLWVHGAIEARCVISDDHSIFAGKKVRADLELDRDTMDDPAIFVDGAFVKGDLDRQKLFALIRAGKPWRRDRKNKPKPTKKG